MSLLGLFDRPGPRWFNIPAHRPFAEDLARGLYEALAPGGPDALSQAVVLTPTRRGARALADAFIAAAGGRAVLPPQIRPVGDLDEGEPPFEPGDLALDLPPAIEPLRRRFELMRLVKANEAMLDRELDAASVLELAEALGGFLDSLQIEEIDPSGGLADLVDADLAAHWRISREFLEKALEEWPRRLDALGVADVSARRVALLQRLAARWDEAPPTGVLIAAGSTGTAPATARLLAVIARAPKGCVVLPGLDQNLAGEAWAKVEEQHPQGALRRLLERAGADRSAVCEWPASASLDTQGRWRRRVVNEALRPAEATADWLTVIETLRKEGEKDRVDAIAEGLKGLSLATARNEEEAATIAALLLRETLETPERTAALVTPDRALARRVTLKLARWGVVPDSSAGYALAGARCAVLAGLVADAAVDPFDPVTLLGLLKHPLVRLGLAPDDLAARRDLLEVAALRGARRRSWAALETAVRKAKVAADVDAALDLLARLRTALEPLAVVNAADEAPPADAARAVTTVMETLAADPSGDLGELWAGHAGECMARLLAALIGEGVDLPAATPRGFVNLLRRLVEGETVRAGGATHPRLRILGAIEARLVRADRLVLAGLEEGVWPQGAPLDPFLSRPMRKRLDLPPPERRIGLSAHDFAQAACAPEVILLHAERREGAPAVKSRWLWRLETLAHGAALKLAARPELAAWARALDAPDGYSPARRPAPTPPVADRPRELAVTRVEALTRDPYGVWARDILKLYKMERPDEPVESRARGTAIHSAFEDFTRAHPRDLPPDAVRQFERLYMDALVEAGMPEDALTREAALAREAAQWVIEIETQRRADGRVLHVELKGAATIRTGRGDFTVTAKADRIEVDPQGFGHILDYKTGRAPSGKMVATGFSPQLTLTAAILERGGFGDIGRAAAGDLTYIEVTGRKPAGRVIVRVAAGADASAAGDRALEGLQALIEAFDDPDRGYASRVAPQFVKLYAGDHDHLARVLEWSTSGEEEGE